MDSGRGLQQLTDAVIFILFGTTSTNVIGWPMPSNINRRLKREDEDKVARHDSSSETDRDGGKALSVYSVSELPVESSSRIPPFPV